MVTIYQQTQIESIQSGSGQTLLFALFGESTFHHFLVTDVFVLFFGGVGGTCKYFIANIPVVIQDTLVKFIQSLHFR